MSLRDDALKLHRDNQGKISVQSKVPVRNSRDLSLAYSPGVAEPCKEIAQGRDLVDVYTNRGNMVAVVSDGTAVLGRSCPMLLNRLGPQLWAQDVPTSLTR